MPDSRPCRCEDVVNCRRCFLWHHDDRYRRLWSGEATPAAAARFRHCRHLGDVTGKGTGCGATNRYRCTLAVYTPDVCHLAECQRCERYEAPA